MLTVFFPDIDLSHKHFFKTILSLSNCPKYEYRFLPIILQLWIFNKLKIKIKFEEILRLNKYIKKYLIFGWSISFNKLFFASKQKINKDDWIMLMIEYSKIIIIRILKCLDRRKVHLMWVEMHLFNKKYGIISKIEQKLSNNSVNLFKSICYPMAFLHILIT